MSYILFGCGHAGAEALLALGKDNVECFCDNSCIKSGDVAYGKPVITFADFLDIYKEHIIVISANKGNGNDISEQLESYEVWDYVFFYDEVKDIAQSIGQKKTLKYLGDGLNRQKCKGDHFRELLRERNEQFTYLRELTNPCSVNTAKGYIRAEQNKSLGLARELMFLFQELNISVFAVGGTLVGAIRHKGFIPWDDDIDFGIMRSDLKRLMNYITGKYFLYERCASGEGNYCALNNALIEHPGEFIFERSAYCMSVIRGTSIADYAIVDLFTFDYFKDNYDYNEYRKLIIETKKKAETTNDENERLKIEEAEVGGNVNICDESSKISFSLDSMMAYDHLHNLGWIPREMIFPVINMDFEHTRIPVPAKPDVFIDFDIPGYHTAPDDIGLSHRIIQRNRYIRNILPSVEFYIDGVDEVELFLQAYKRLRSNGVFTVYVVERDHLYRRKKNVYGEIIAKLRRIEAEFYNRHNCSATLGVIATKACMDNHLYKHIYEYNSEAESIDELVSNIFETLKGIVE